MVTDCSLAFAGSIQGRYVPNSVHEVRRGHIVRVGIHREQGWVQSPLRYEATHGHELYQKNVASRSIVALQKAGGSL